MSNQYIRKDRDPMKPTPDMATPRPIHYVIICPQCNEEWDIIVQNVCQCGAIRKTYAQSIEEDGSEAFEKWLNDPRAELKDMPIESANMLQVHQYCEKHHEHYFGYCPLCPQPTLTTSTTAGIVNVSAQPIADSKEAQESRVPEWLERKSIVKLPEYLKDADRSKGAFSWRQGYIAGATDFIGPKPDLESKIAAKDIQIAGLEAANKELAQKYEDACMGITDREGVTIEDRDVFAMSFYVFVLTDPRAIALRDAKSPMGAILSLYKDRPYLNEDVSAQ